MTSLSASSLSSLVMTYILFSVSHCRIVEDYTSSVTSVVGFQCSSRSLYHSQLYTCIILYIQCVIYIYIYNYYVCIACTIIERFSSFCSCRNTERTNNSSSDTAAAETQREPATVVVTLQHIYNIIYIYIALSCMLTISFYGFSNL